MQREKKGKESHEKKKGGRLSSTEKVKKRKRVCEGGNEGGTTD